MTENDLLKEVLQGVLLIVGEYRGSYAEMAGYVGKKSGNAIQYVRATHVVECSWHGHINRVIISEPAKIILLTNTSLALRSPKLPLLKCLQLLHQRSLCKLRRRIGRRLARRLGVKWKE